MHTLTPMLETLQERVHTSAQIFALRKYLTIIIQDKDQLFLVQARKMITLHFLEYHRLVQFSKKIILSVDFAIMTING